MRATNQFTFDNLATAPAFVLDGYAASLSSLLGFATPDDGAARVGEGAARGRRRARGRRAVVALGGCRAGSGWCSAIGVVFWFLIARQRELLPQRRHLPLPVRRASCFVLMAAAELGAGPAAEPGRGRDRARGRRRRGRRQPARAARRLQRPPRR